MRINRIVVTGLFGVFNHDIPLNMDDRITIIHGPNGYGKTILLTMLRDIFRGQYHRCLPIPFKDVKITFDDDSVLTLEKISNGASSVDLNNNTDLSVKYKEKGKKIKEEKLKKIDQKEIPFPLRMIEELIDGLTRVGGDQWLYKPTNEVFSFHEVMVRFSDQLPYPLSIKHKIPAWLGNINKSVELNFIETQRLLSVMAPDEERIFLPGRMSRNQVTQLGPAVMKYSGHLARTLQSKLAEYGSLSQSLDRTFPSRLVKGNKEVNPTTEQLQKDLEQLAEKRSRLVSTGFLDKKEGEIDVNDSQRIDENNIYVLSVYIKDVKEKLGFFDDLTKKIDLFLNIINKKFLFKKLSIDKEKGFVFKTEEGKSLSPTLLSSGEQHELILLYELLFKIKEDALILIDEPELSLHAKWQYDFIQDLKSITEVANFDVLMATHSPLIINDRWDLTVELKGPEN